MQAESGPTQDHGLRDTLASLVSWPVLRLALVYFGLTTGLYGIELWLPQIVKGFGGLSNIEVGFISAIPYLAAICTMGFWARHSDRTGDRFGHVALPCALGCAGLFVAGIFHEHAVATMALLSLAIAAVMSARPPFWALPSDFLSGQKAAAGIAVINSIGNLGGFAGPFLIGWAREATGSFTAGLMISAVTLLAAALFTLSLRRSAQSASRVIPAL
jgi:ACS family tartrate transporter-like MFS transporter